ncbi:MAG TPA: DinB family protein [Acidimicrobiales bacterium]|nr:DinB family protein [Acidimicrobiales bacterium]
MGDDGDDLLGARSDERTTLTGTLDWYRGVVENKIHGLGREDASRSMTPSGLSQLGVVKHLAWVERGWFQEIYAGRDVEMLEGDDDSLEFAIGPGDTVETIRDFYRAQVSESRAVTDAAPGLDALSARETPMRGRVSLRWVLVHMIEETARHAGHLDLMREAVDGRVGD